MLDPKEEARFAELKSMCRELHVPAPPEIMIGLRVHDRNGVLIFDDKQRGHSWTRNYWNRLFAFSSQGALADSSFGAGYYSLKNSTGAIYNGYAFSLVGLFDGGLVVGTGDAAFSIDQYAMATQIADGVGAGQLSHQAISAKTAAYTAGTKTWKTTAYRIFNNNSGGSITVKETGIYGLQGGQYYLFERSVLSPTVAVANGAQLTVTYEISMDFSAID